VALFIPESTFGASFLSSTEAGSAVDYCYCRLNIAKRKDKRMKYKPFEIEKENDLSTENSFNTNV
jgi:hypothetical protein